MGTYVLAVPAGLELWLLHDKPVHAIVFVVLHFLASQIVDAAIYEVRLYSSLAMTS